MSDQELIIDLPDQTDGDWTMTISNDPINHPKHYGSHPTGVKCIDIVEHFSYNVGNAVKYLWRAGLKEDNPAITDLKKARWYIDRAIANEELEEHSDAFPKCSTFDEEDGEKHSIYDTFDES